jgi:linoleoyl-CoA desaturase
MSSTLIPNTLHVRLPAKTPPGELYGDADAAESAVLSDSSEGAATEPYASSASSSSDEDDVAAPLAPLQNPKKWHSSEDLHVVRGRFYDLSSFDHPGGDLMIAQSKGQDITAAVAAHHFTDAPYRVLHKFEVPAHRVRGGVTASDVVGGGYSFKEDGFHSVLKRRIIDQLAGGDAHKMRQVTRPSTYYKLRVAATFAIYFASWGWCCFGGQFLWSAAFLAGATRTVLVGIGHEAIHGRLGSGPLFYLFGAVLCFPSEIWHDEHVLQHHPHTKRDGLDPDEHGLAPMLRLNRFQKWSFWHAAQLLVQFFISFFFSMATWIQHSVVETILSPKDPKQWRDFAFQTFALFSFQLLPFFTAPTLFDACLTVATVVGLSNALTLHAFHISHINENNEAVGALKEGMDWGEWQCRTSSNWNSVWYSVTGMLEYQIEHHLFPSLPYAQQDQIRPLVKKTCAEFDIPYFEYPSMAAGLFAHVKYLWGVSMDGFRRENNSSKNKVD